MNLTKGLPLPAVVVLTALWWTAVFNYPFWTWFNAAAGGLPPEGAAVVMAAFFLIALGLIRLTAMLPYRLFQLVMLVVNAVGAVAFCAALLYGARMTPDMIRNALATDGGEVAAYISLRTVALLLVSAIPPITAALVMRRPSRAFGPFERRPRWGKTRAALLVAAAWVLAVVLIMSQFQLFAGAMRADRSMRYGIAPVNVFYSLGKTLAGDKDPDRTGPRRVIAPDARLGVKSDAGTLVVVAVGETARAANWGLSGYKRDTTPELRKRGVINFADVTACGTSTDVSLPCMMSRIGRAEYDRKAILTEEALPAILQRAGARVVWIENQGGCKGACQDVPTRRPDDPALCRDGACMDGALVGEVKKELAAVKPGTTTVVFLHMMGSHGPAYAKRYPADQAYYADPCKDADLSSCSREAIVAAYDNSIRYTDRVLAETIDALKAAGRVDTALLFLSDHGESLGEDGLYLHGAPYFMAPDEQTKIPMVMWVSPAFARDYGIDRDKLRTTALKEAVSQDMLFSSLLGLLNVQTRVYDAKRDFTH